MSVAVFLIHNKALNRQKKEAVYRILAYLKEKGIHFVALSAHDTCDWSLHAFEETFGNDYHVVKVGERLSI